MSIISVQMGNGTGNCDMNNCNHGCAMNLCYICNLELSQRVLIERLEKLEEKISEKYAHPCVISRIEKLEKLNDNNAKILNALIDKVHENRMLAHKIEKLETLTDIGKVEKLIFEGAQTHAAILRCETKNKDLESQIKALTEIYKEVTLQFAKVFDKNIALEERLVKLESTEEGKKPHICPVCDGKGFFKNDDGSFNCNLTCFPCRGQGIVWG